MAPRRVRKTSRRVSFKKAQRKVERAQRKKAKSNKDTHSLKLVREFLVPAAPGTVSGVTNYVGTYQPLAIADGSPGSVWTWPEFQLYKQMYDRVRINSVNLQWIPKANVFDAETAMGSTTIEVNGDMNFHTVIDQDSRAPTNIPSLQRYSSYKKFHMLRKWSRTMRMTYPKNYWINCQNGLSDTNTLQSIGGCSYITAYAENLPLPLQNPVYNDVGTFKITFNVVFQGKIIPAVSVNDDGGVTIYSTHQVYSAPPSELVARDEVTLQTPDGYDLRENLPCECPGPTGPTGPEGPAPK